MTETIFEQVEKAWSADSEDYDNLIRKQLKNKEAVEHWQNELKTVLGEKPLRVLDIGCGPGFFTIMLARLGHRVTSVDGAEGMVACARRNAEREGLNADVYLGDAIRLDREENESFDAIVSRDVVWTLYDPEKAFKRWRTLLKEGGKIVIYDGDYRRDQSSPRYYCLKLISSVIAFFSERPRRSKRQHGTSGNGFEQLPMIKHKRPQQDRELLMKAGFEKVEITSDRFRNSPGRIEFWKYGYQGRKFRVVAYK
jgi:SAM-dependent methyltransferase